MKRRTSNHAAVFIFTGAALAAVLPAAQANPRGMALMQQMKSAFKGVRSYQATCDMTMTGSGQNVTTVMRIKALPNAGKTRMETTGSGHMAAMLSSTVVDDGKNMYMYMPANKSWYKRPHMASNSQNPMTMNYANLPGVTMDYLRDENLGGRSVHVLSMKMANMPASMKQQTLLYIDRSTKRTVQTTTSMSMGGTSKMNMKMRVRNEVLNAPIPDSTFRFTPPPGSREMKNSIPTNSRPRR